MLAAEAATALTARIAVVVVVPRYSIRGFIYRNKKAHKLFIMKMMEYYIIIN
jgi:hypothetical protein